MLTLFFAITLVSVINYKTERSTTKEIKVLAFSGGCGESWDPYIISSADDLRQLSARVANGNRCAGDYFELSTDIYMYGEEFLPIGFYRGDQSDYGDTANDNLIFPFCGNFNGNNHTIYDLSFINLGTLETWYYHSSSSGAGYSYCVGLFCVLSNGAYISNLRLVNPIYSISYNAHDGAIPYGGIAGAYISSSTENKSAATITNCVVQNLKINDKFNYYKDSDGTYVGGIVGGKIGAGTLTIENCYAEGVSTSVATTSIAGIGPSLVDGPTSIKNCVYAKKSQSISFSISNGGSETNCTATAGDVSGLDYSSIGNEDSNDSDYDTLWYYGGSLYNDGYPFLRRFISYWTNFWFEKDTSFVGDIDNRVVCIPLFDPDGDDIKGKAINYLNSNLANKSLTFFNQTVTATPDSGYTFDAWVDAGYSGANKVYEATANADLFNITFGNAIGVQTGDTIGPEEDTINFRVAYNTTITVSHRTGNGPLTLIYTFDYIEGEERKEGKITYEITTKYKLKNSNNPGMITGPTATIRPTLEIKTCEVSINVENGYMTYLDDDNTTQSGESFSFTVNYGTSWTFNDTDEDYIYLSPVDIFPTDNTYVYDGIQILKNGEVVTKDVLSNITSNLEITIWFVKMHTVTFNKIDNTSTPTRNQTMIVKGGDGIAVELSDDNKTLTYSYYDQVVEYNASNYYILQDESNRTSIAIPEDGVEITPIATFYACEVTIWKDDVSNIATLHVDGAKKTSSYIFIVEYGTEVEFATPTQSEGKFTYTYIFTYTGEEIARITYTITDDDYAMSSELTADGRVWHSDLGETNKATEYEFESTLGTTYLISPTFELKEYGGNVA